MGAKKAPRVDHSEETAKAEAEAERKKIIERQRRGLAGTIRTSNRGILYPGDRGLKRKKLLGE